MTKLTLEKNLTFGFEQTFTTTDWWVEPGFTATSDTPLKREKMLALAKELAPLLKGKFFESKDIWDHMQYEVTNEAGETQFYVTMDPGSIEVKTPPCLWHETRNMAEPLFIAAERAGLVPYRNWWYGVKGGTEGGCHVNMGGRNDETNPLKQNPDLVVKYAAYIHNRPFLHYPFMGLDVGPEGNAMRMDEKPGFDEIKTKLAQYPLGEFEAKQVHPYFAETNLIKEKASFPSLYKFKEGLYLIEDRGQESLREAEDFYLVSLLRLRILQSLQESEKIEELQSFPQLHKEGLTSFKLWDDFQVWAKTLDLPVEKYQRFFERQFPVLLGGETVPESFTLKDGRRPRVVKDIIKRGDVIVSKNIDTTYKRFEVFTNSPCTHFEIETKGVEYLSKLIESGESKYHFIDLKYDPQEPKLTIKLFDNQELIEECDFNIHNMMWE